MKVLFLLAFIGLGQGALLGSRKCTYGPSFWCSHVDHARECSAVQYCMTTVWKKQLQGMTGSTEGCFDVIETLDDVRHSGIPHNVLEKMATSCTKMTAEKRSVCKELMMKNKKEVQLLLQSDLPSVNVATVLGLCGGFSDSVPHPRVEDSKQVVQETGDICTDCLNFFEDLQEIVNKSEERIAQNLKDKICVKLGFFENLCNETVDTYTEFFLNFLAQQLNPQDLCFLFRFCGNRTHAEIVKSIKSLAAKAKLHSVECDVCQSFAKDVQDALRDTAVQNEIISLLENDVCALLPGDLGTQCKTYVSQYGPMVFQVLIAELDPATICQTLGFCNATAAEKKLAVVPLGEALTNVRLQRPESQSQEQSTPECFFCEYIIKKLESEIFTNATEEEVIAALEKICSEMPEEYKTKCDAFVETYGHEIAQFLKQMAPNAICTALHLCIVDKPVQKSPVVPVKNAEVCLVCEAVVTSIRDYINNPDHQKTIEQFLDEVCYLVPSSYKQMCLQLLDTYAPIFIQLLNQYDDPVKVCTTVDLCSSSKKMESNESGHPLSFVSMMELQPAMPLELCRQDPKVFCATLESAKRCKAVEFCAENYNLEVHA